MYVFPFTILGNKPQRSRGHSNSLLKIKIININGMHIFIIIFIFYLILMECITIMFILFNIFVSFK